MLTVSANKATGRLIAQTRAAEGISQETLSDRINDACGILISADAIGRYERGERRIDMDALVAIAIGLDVPLQQLLDGIDPRNGVQPEMRNPMNKLSPEEHAIFRYIATDWSGDRKALIIANAVYAALSPAHRRDIIMDIMIHVSNALSAGEISPSDLPHGLPYLEQHLGEMYAEDT